MTTAEPNTEQPYAVELEGIEKRFPGVIANHDVSLKVRKGTIHAIVGENGAGKSTLMKTLYGMHQPEAGTIHVNGQQVHFKSPAEAIAVGIGMVHQHFMLADNLTVLENVILGAEPARRGVIRHAEGTAKVAALAKQIGAHVDLDAPLSALGVGQRQRVEILKVLYRGANILILDEPTAVLVPQEVDELFETLKVLVAGGATVIFISHKLDEVLAVSDEITVIRQGTTVGTVTPDSITRSRLGEMMVGSELPKPIPRETKIGTAVRLEVNGASAKVVGPGSQKYVFQDIDIDVHEGEIVGVAGVEGNGQFELCEGILGLMPLTAGTIVLDAKDVTHETVRHRKDAGIGYIPFDRHREALMLSSPLWENTMLGRESQPKFNIGPLINVRGSQADCREIIHDFDVRTPGENVPAFALSGGNQQKLIVGRELVNNPSVLIAAHPTRGVDIGAQNAIWARLRTARDAGMGVLLLSADLEELIALSDVIVVMFDGMITARLTPAQATPELLGLYMTGTRQEAVA